MCAHKWLYKALTVGYDLVISNVLVIFVILPSGITDTRDADRSEIGDSLVYINSPVEEIVI